jgi:hypothetical protein
LINFRYHIVSLIAVFLALAIGVIMGSAVIDRAIVNRLEDQQRSLEKRLTGIEGENDDLRGENRVLRTTAERLAEQGSQRLLADTLTGVPVLVVAERGAETAGFSDLLSLLGTSGADQRGTIWLDDRFALDKNDERRDLATALKEPATASVESLRSLALARLAAYLRDGVGAAALADPSVTTTSTTAPVTTTTEASSATAEEAFGALRDAGFVDFDAPEGSSSDAGPELTPGTRLIVVSGPGAKVAPDVVAVPLTKLLLGAGATEGADALPISLLAAEDRGVEAPKVEFTVALRRDKDVAERLSTVDNIGDFAGRLAAVLALVDLGAGRVGHYGTGPGAQRLLPAPPEK